MAICIHFIFVLSISLCVLPLVSGLVELTEVYLGHQQKSQNADPRSDFLLWST